MNFPKNTFQKRKERIFPKIIQFISTPKPRDVILLILDAYVFIAPTLVSWSISQLAGYNFRFSKINLT